MNFGKIVKTVIKYGPVVYPIVKKLLDEKKKASSTTKSSSYRSK